MHSVTTPGTTGVCSTSGRQSLRPSGAQTFTQQPDPFAGVRVLLLDGVGLSRGVASVRLSLGLQRLLAFLALAGRAVRRDLVAGTLWPEVSEQRAHMCLRAALARLARRSPGVLRADALDVVLAAGVSVDLDDARLPARRLLTEPGAVSAWEAAAAVAGLSLELLPGWYEDWALLAAEDWRQLRLHALEAAAHVLASAGRFGEAVAAARAAVAADPLRESPRAALIAVHLAEGNQSEAVREFACYRQQLGAGLGLEPTGRLRALLPA
jgi:SARP family transcriptional regulator, regulator of embCAB operon